MKTVKNRKRKFALGMKIAALCSCLVLASVGFASWLVIHEPEDKTAEGSVNVALTEEAKLLIDNFSVVNPSETNVSTNKFSFGKPASQGTVPIRWLVPKEVETEDLLEEYTLTFKPQNLPVGTNANFTLNFDAVYKTVSGETTNYAERNTDLATLIEKGYLTLTVKFGGTTKVYNDAKEGENFTNPLPAEGVSITYTADWDTLSAAASGKTIEFSIQFGWGSVFDYKNPYIHYNSIENPAPEETLAAYNVLTEIAATIKGSNHGTGEPISYLVVIDAELDLSAVTY